MSVVKPAKALYAAFLVRSNLRRPALEQKLHLWAKPELGSGSRHRNQYSRWTFQAARLARIIL